MYRINVTGQRCEEEQGLFDNKTMVNLWFVGLVTKTERFRTMHTVRTALEATAHTIKNKEFRLTIELSPGRRAILRVEARVLAVREQH